MTPLLLGILAVALAGPVPALLGRIRVFRSVPRAAVALRRSVALAATLAAVGSGLALALRLVISGGRAGGLDLGTQRIGAHSPGPSTPLMRGPIVATGAADFEGYSTSQVLHRVERLAGVGRRRVARLVLAAATYGAAAVILVVPTVTVALPWLRAAWRIVV